MGPAWSIAGAGALAATAQIVNGKWPSPRILAGVGIAGAALLILQGSSPQTASAFGTLVFLTALMVYGFDIAKAVANLINR